MSKATPQNVVRKILSAHLLDGELVVGGEVGIRIDQTLTQDATGTTAFLLFEAMGTERVRTELSVSYVDHNMAQFGPENHNDHLYLQSIAAKVGAIHSRPGNGICHQVHLERFARPGKTLLGSDSHTPSAGGMGMLAIGAGGLDVAVAMGGGAFYTASPRVIAVELVGELRQWVSAKDIILRLLSILTTRGNVGCVVEYFGEGVSTLAVPGRATCANMGAELGVTSSVFPADDMTRQFLNAQGRGEQFVALSADDGATYDRITKILHVDRDAVTIDEIRKHCIDVEITDADEAGMLEVSFGGVRIDLNRLEPLASGSPSPDNVLPVSRLAGTEVAQVVIGSCTNSSFQDLMLCASVLRGRTVHPNVEMGVAPGSRQVLIMLAQNNALGEFVRTGARILESACGPCIGQGFSPAEGAVSLRTFNRNFPGRSGTEGDRVYLVSPETAIAAALTGTVTDPRDLPSLGIEYHREPIPENFLVDDSLLIEPLPEGEAGKGEIVRGSTIVKPPVGEPLPDTLTGEVLIKVGDKITTDHITPAGAFLKYRSNVPQYARFVFNCFSEQRGRTFTERALQAKESGRAGVIVAGDSYGQGSSREHAALCPMYLGVRAVIAKAIERIHQANLVNFGILPLKFADKRDYDRIEAGDELVIEQTGAAIAGGDRLAVCDVTEGFEFICQVILPPRQRRILTAGGLLNYTRDGG